VKRTLTGLFLIAFAGCASADDSAATVAPDAGGVVQADPIDPACPKGLTWCGLGCVDLQTSLGNCGVCNLHCASTMHCSQGSCVDNQ
jgi:hypothetical protein